MTQQDRTTIKSKFEQGDKPQGSDYVDWVDSTVFLANTTAQSVASPITVVGALGASTTVSAQSVEASAATITGTVSAATGNFTAVVATTVSADTVAASAANFTRMSAANVSANALGITGSLTWTAEVTASVVSTGQQTITGLLVNKFIIVQVSGQTVGIPCFKVS